MPVMLVAPRGPRSCGLLCRDAGASWACSARHEWLCTSPEEASRGRMRRSGGQCMEEWLLSALPCWWPWRWQSKASFSPGGASCLGPIHDAWGSLCENPVRFVDEGRRSHWRYAFLGGVISRSSLETISALARLDFVSLWRLHPVLATWMRDVEVCRAHAEAIIVVVATRGCHMLVRLTGCSEPQRLALHG